MLEPFGSQQEDRHFGTIAATIANVQRTKKSQKVWSWKDFFPEFQDRNTTDKQTVDEQITIVEMLNEAFGGEDKRQNKTAPTV